MCGSGCVQGIARPGTIDLHRRSSVVCRSWPRPSCVIPCPTQEVVSGVQDGIRDATTFAIPIREAATRYRNTSVSPATRVGPLSFLAPSPLPIKPRTSTVSFRKPEGTIEIASPERKPSQLCLRLVSLKPTRQGNSRLCHEPMSINLSAPDPETLADCLILVKRRLLLPLLTLS